MQRLRSRGSGLTGAFFLLVFVCLLLSAPFALAGPLTVSPPQPVAATAFGEFVADIDGTRVVWAERNVDDDIYVRDVASAAPATRLTNNSSADVGARISGPNVVWQGDDGDTEVFYRDLNATTAQGVAE